MNFGPFFSKFMLMGFDALREGKLPQIAKGAFYSLFSLVLFMATGYLANIDKRLGSLESSIKEMSMSVVDLNRAMALNIETTGWHGKEIQRHSREIERQWDRIVELEGSVRRGGIEVPKSSARNSKQREEKKAE